jgi:RimJ/RimL family protein N-acetyltransferase
LRALLDADLDEASRIQGVELGEQFLASAGDYFLRVQLERMTTNPQRRGWCARTMLGREGGAVIGHCGFHGPPEDVGRAEIGYTVLPAFRGRGYATEAASALVEYARGQEVATVFATVAPDNAPSLRVVEKLGFRQTGVQIDEIDGEELVFELDLGAGAPSVTGRRPGARLR